MNTDTNRLKMTPDPKEPFRKFFELFTKDLKEQPNVIEHLSATREAETETKQYNSTYSGKKFILHNQKCTKQLMNT